jgi:SOS-response transcriptional repressor LexA
MVTAHRQSPTAASRRVLALSFIREYFDRHGESPSFGEIAAALGLGCTVKDVSRIVRALDRAGDVVHVPGARRGIRLPDAIDEIATREALLVLRRRGWVVNEGARTVAGAIKSGDDRASATGDIASSGLLAAGDANGIDEAREGRRAA